MIVIVQKGYCEDEWSVCETVKVSRDQEAW